MIASKSQSQAIPPKRSGPLASRTKLAIASIIVLIWVGNPATGFWVNLPIWAFYLRLACRAVTGMLADLSV
jgi:hypothetical protein